MQTSVHRWASYFSFDARAPNSDMSDVTLVIWLDSDSPKTDLSMTTMNLLGTWRRQNSRNTVQY